MSDDDLEQLIRGRMRAMAGKAPDNQQTKAAIHAAVAINNRVQTSRVRRAFSRFRGWLPDVPRSYRPVLALAVLLVVAVAGTTVPAYHGQPLSHFIVPGDDRTPTPKPSPAGTPAAPRATPVRPAAQWYDSFNFSPYLAGQCATAIAKRVAIASTGGSSPMIALEGPCPGNTEFWIVILAPTANGAQTIWFRSVVGTLQSFQATKTGLAYSYVGAPPNGAASSSGSLAIMSQSVSVSRRVATTSAVTDVTPQCQIGGVSVGQVMVLSTNTPTPAPPVTATLVPGELPTPTATPAAPGGSTGSVLPGYRVATPFALWFHATAAPCWISPSAVSVTLRDSSGSVVRTITTSPAGTPAPASSSVTPHVANGQPTDSGSADRFYVANPKAGNTFYLSIDPAPPASGPQACSAAAGSAATSLDLKASWTRAQHFEIPAIYACVGARVVVGTGKAPGA